MESFKYKHELLGGCSEKLAEKELAKMNIPSKIFWEFPKLIIFCNRKNVKDIQKVICMYRNGDPIAYKNHLYEEVT